ncbi:MAG: hypothetical protein Q9160_001214 [Pyrenula sp. 1 TL-2023]
MPLIEESHDSLPYIDIDASPEERAKAERLIASELPPDYQSKLHSTLPPPPEFRFSSLIQTELDRKATGIPISSGVELSRYEAPETPSKNDTASWQSTLRNAYSSSSYLSGRLTNLSLLEEFGKNAWLIGNWQLEEILRGLEKELTELKETTDNVNKTRKANQEGSKGEIVALEETWKRGVGKIIEIELATEGLRKEILARRRQNSH